MTTDLPFSTPPKPALTYEDMWFQVKEYLAGMVLDRKTPQAVFNVRELMGELERQRIKPLELYVRQRKGIDSAQSSVTPSRRNRFRGGGTTQRPVLGLGEKENGGQVSA